MNNDLSLFNEVDNEEIGQQTVQQTLEESMSELIANRSSVMQKYAQETESMFPEEKSEETPLAEQVYKEEEIFQDVVRYFDGDELAAGVWID